MTLIKISLITLLILLAAYQVKTNDRTQKGGGNAPVISSTADEIRIPCQYERQDLLQGLSAYDVEDGYITDQILIGGFSDFTERGVSSLEYAVYDKDGNMATLNRKVIFTDYIPPRITISGPWVFKPTDSPYNIPVLSPEATDKLDGDISRKILLTSTDLDFAKSGKYTASVFLRNSFGDEVSLDLPIHILDSGINGLAIELKEPVIYVNRGTDVDPESCIAAVRNEYTSEKLASNAYELTVNSGVDTSKDGTYEIQYSVISTDKVQRGETWLTVIVGDYGG